MESLKQLYDVVKSDFCNLLDYKLRGSTLEILTGIPTINLSTVSVFVSFDGTKYIASDGGWVDDNVYDSSDFDDQEIYDRITDQYAQYFGIKTVYNANGTLYYYKTCHELSHLSAIVHDIGHYVAMVVNARNTTFNAPDEGTVQRQQFQTRINQHLKKHYGEDSVQTNQTVRLKDNKTIRLSAIVRLKEKQKIRQYYLMYVTGYRKDLFIKDITKATVNFQIIEENAMPAEYYQRLAVVNTAATGYDKTLGSLYLNQLATFSDRLPIYLGDENLRDVFTSVMPYSM